MTAALTTGARRPVLADLLPGQLVRDVSLVAGGAATIGVAAQLAVPLPFTPVPLTLQTLAVLLIGAALGPVRGLATTLLYLLAGSAGVPWFSGASSGWGGASFGYVVGFVLASAVLGWLARRRADRAVPSALGAMLLASLAIYAVGVPWLMAVAHVSLAQAIALGVAPFLVGDIVKVVVAAGLLPAAWRLLGPAD
jgi:biotin transport system substrate-specific component